MTLRGRRKAGRRDHGYLRPGLLAAYGRGNGVAGLERDIAGDGTENWRLILEAARALTAAGQSPFTRVSVYEWIWRRYPRSAHDRPSLDPVFQGMVRNAPGQPPVPRGRPWPGSTAASTPWPTLPRTPNISGSGLGDRQRSTHPQMNQFCTAVDRRFHPGMRVRAVTCCLFIVSLASLGHNEYALAAEQIAGIYWPPPHSSFAVLASGNQFSVLGPT